jgi:anti-sigma B factor antagonist
MEMEAEVIGAIKFVKLTAESKIHSTNNKEFVRALTEHTQQMEPNTTLVFDMAEVTYIDSAALGSILAGLAHMRKKGGDLKLCNMQNRVRAIFELTRVHHVCDIFNTKQEAIDAHQ